MEKRRNWTWGRRQFIFSTKERDWACARLQKRLSLLLGPRLKKKEGAGYVDVGKGSQEFKENKFLCQKDIHVLILRGIYQIASSG